MVLLDYIKKYRSRTPYIQGKGLTPRYEYGVPATSRGSKEEKDMIPTGYSSDRRRRVPGTDGQHPQYGRGVRITFIFIMTIMMTFFLYSCTEANPFPFPEEKIYGDAEGPDPATDIKPSEGTASEDNNGTSAGSGSEEGTGTGSPVYPQPEIPNTETESGGTDVAGGAGEEVPGTGPESGSGDNPETTEGGESSGGTAGDTGAGSVVIKKPVPVGSDAVFIEPGTPVEIDIPSGNRAWAILVNSGEDWTDGGLHNAKYTVEAPEEKALVRYSTTLPGYEYYAGVERLVWRNMNRVSGGTCDAYEYGRDEGAGVIYLIDATMSTEYATNMKTLITDLHEKYPGAFSADTLRNAEDLAGIYPTTLYRENGRRYLFVLLTDFGQDTEDTLGVYSTSCQLLGTYPAININGRAFKTTESDAWNFGTTIAHEYSHFLESYGRQQSTGRPGFGCHLTAEGYADWSAMKSTGRSPLSEAGYLAFWLEEGNLWHPSAEHISGDGFSLRLADYGLGCLLWDRLYTEYGDAAVKKTLGYTGGDLGGFEASTDTDFGIWFREAVLDVIESIGATGIDDGSEDYLMGYRLDWIWNVVTDYLGPAATGTTTVPMTGTGVKVVPLPEGTWAFGYEGADECLLFSLPKPVQP